ncbi:RAVE subunit 2/Rogdi [Coniella lustricola]|uniref:RAVE subunit 2/Rogdi n=1 Tax=Coniella lustricola TaxID=2025994 RepID=A0A2T2ZU31_9PEZI|nr:RAVE subunit 2/Rogdi [Coniella lustricola]
MSVEIWPALPPEQLQPAIDQTQQLELSWLLSELHSTLHSLKSGLEDCYALLAPVDPGSTLVVSTPRNEVVKGHITRIGTRIVKGTLTLRLRTHPQQTYTISPTAPISIAPLTTLNALLTHSIELVTLTLTYATPPPSPSRASKSSSSSNRPSSPAHSTATFLAAQLLLLSQSLTEALSLLKGPQPLTASDATWVSKSCAPDHFVPSTNRDLSIHWGVQDSSLVLWLRALEPADAPVSVGLKFALAIGTARRIEHDEADQLFVYTYPENTEAGTSNAGSNSGSSNNNNNNHSSSTNAEDKKNGKQHSGGAGNAAKGLQNSSRNKEDHRANEVQVYVREKVRVESADPSLLSLSAKLGALNYTLELARANLAAVMGESFDG